MHSLLKRQLRKHFGDAGEIPAEMRAFCDSVDAAYREFDEDRGMLERALELNSRELMQANAGLRADIDRRARAEEELRDRTRQVLRHHSLLHELAVSRPDDREAALARISEVAARALEIARVGIWLFDAARSNMVCAGFWQQRWNRSGHSSSLPFEACPRYRAALEAGLALTVPDALRDERTAELRELFLIPNGIGALLDVPIRAHGRTIGVVCHAQVGSPRAWTLEEQHFAAAIAGIVSDTLGAFERQALEGQLRQSQKMEAVGRLAGGIAHDFNNLLTAIVGFSELALPRVNGSAQSHVNEIRSTALRAAELTRQLLAFSRRQVLTPRNLDLNSLVAGTERMLRVMVGEPFRLSTVLAADPGLVHADPGQLEQVLVNLVVNARDAMPSGGEIRIETAELLPDTSLLALHTGLAATPHVSLSVRDSGSGMDAETLARIFEPFFTTKGAGRGTGLGLSTVYGIVEQSGGRVWAESTPGLGSVFHVLLPAALRSQPAEAPETDAAQPALRGAAEVVLLVEDEATVRALSRRALECHGYHVIEASGAAQALDWLARHGTPVHLLLTDVVMPDMDGRSLAARVRSLRPGIRVMYTSGYHDMVASEDEFRAEGAEFLPKPYTLGSLYACVRRALAAEPALAPA